MPPPRPTEPLSEDAQMKLEKDLRATRDRQEAVEGRTPDGGKTGTAKKSAPVATKKAGPGAQKPLEVTKKQSSDVIIVPPAGVASKP